MLVLFDVNGTVLSFDPVRRALTSAGYPAEVFDLWFARMLQASDASTMAGRYRQFADFAAPALRQVLAVRGLPDDGVDDAVEILASRLELRAGGRGCLDALAQAGHRIAALTKSSASSTRQQLRRTGALDYFDDVISCDDVGATKPDPRPYVYALATLGAGTDSTVFVAAHGWDVIGADAVGLPTIWVSEEEEVWALPDAPPGAVAAVLTEVPSEVDRMTAAHAS